MYLKTALYSEPKHIDIKRFNLPQHHISEPVSEPGWFYQPEGLPVWPVYRVGGAVGPSNRGEDSSKISPQPQHLIKRRSCPKSYNKMTDNKSLIIYESQHRIYFFYHYMFLLIIHYLTANSGFPGVMSPSYNATGQFLSQRLLLHLNLGATICLGASDLINSSVSISSGISSSSGSCNRIGTAAGLRTKQFKRDISC